MFYRWNCASSSFNFNSTWNISRVDQFTPWAALEWDSKAEALLFIFLQIKLIEVEQRNLNVLERRWKQRCADMKILKKWKHQTTSLHHVHTLLCIACTLYLTFRGILTMLTLSTRESSADDGPKFFNYFFFRKFSTFKCLLSYSDSE